jgi:hypothetical protein
MTKEQSPNMTDDELRDYVTIKYKSKRLYTTGETLAIPKEY